jgi:hypothetical protein
MSKYFKEMPKIISIATKYKGRRGSRHGGNSFWIITWYAKDFVGLRLVTSGGHFRFYPPADGALEATRSSTEGSACAGVLELIGPGAIDSASHRYDDRDKAPEGSQAKQVY